MLVRVLYTRLDANPEEFTYSRGGIALPFALFILVGIRTYLRGGIFALLHVRSNTIFLRFARTYVVASVSSRPYF